jgi:WD40 repeat protein
MRREFASAQFSPDGQRVVTASYDKTARLWDAATGKPIGEPMKHEGAVNSAQFSLDSQRVVTVSDDDTARLWDAATGKAIGQPMKHGKVKFQQRYQKSHRPVILASLGVRRLQPRYDLSRQVLSRFWSRFQASCQPPGFFSSRLLTIQNRPNYRGMYPTAAKALGRCCCRRGALQLEPAMSILPRHARSTPL